MAAVFENGCFRRPFWNFTILNILISFRMSKNIWIDTKIVKIDHFYIFNISPMKGDDHLGFLRFDENAQECQSGHSSDLDSAPQNLPETAEKITIYKKRG